MQRTLTILHTEASKGWGGQEIRVIQEATRFAELGYREEAAKMAASGREKILKGFTFKKMKESTIGVKKIF